MLFRSVSQSRYAARDVVFVGECNLKIALCHFVFSFGKNGDVAHHTVVVDAVYVASHLFSLQFLIMSMPIAMSANAALHIAMMVAPIPVAIMMFTAGCLLALLRSQG